MKVIEPSVKVWLPNVPGMLERLEEAGRTAYRSEHKISEGSAEKFLAMIVRRGHESVLEHESIQVRFTVDRGISHEIVRHRHASFTQESTRYVSYDDGFQVIRPFWLGQAGAEIWYLSMRSAEERYKMLLKEGWTPQQARTVLPHSVATELFATMNIRSWRNFLTLRSAKDAHPQIQQVARPLAIRLANEIPVLFSDIAQDLTHERWDAKVHVFRPEHRPKIQQ